ncbi:alcohol dehydrogenase catalytic domain-containing protein, partial [Streptomyces sp. DSM 44915]
MAEGGSGVWVAGETQLAVRDGRVLAARLAPVSTAASLIPPADSWSWQLRQGQGQISDISLVDRPELLAPLEPEQVRVELWYSGVNFRDAGVALKVVPDFGWRVGSEASGVVVGVGSGVSGVGVGDVVFGAFDGSFGPLGVTDYRLVRPVP